jgi:hypothetical protein
VNVFAKVKGDVTVFRNVRDGDAVTIEKNPLKDQPNGTIA